MPLSPSSPFGRTSFHSYPLHWRIGHNGSEICIRKAVLPAWNYEESCSRCNVCTVRLLHVVNESLVLPSATSTLAYTDNHTPLISTLQLGAQEWLNKLASGYNARP